MINVLMCVYKSGDVLGLTLRQFVDSPVVSRILVADGPHRGPIKPGHKADHPAVHIVVAKLKSDKIVYQHTNDCPTRADKNNRVLKHISDDCDWVLVADSDEVYHEDGLKRLAKFLKTAEYGRYAVHSINPYPDFRHQFKIPDWKPRVYRWMDGARCAPKHDRMHQCVLHPEQKKCHRGQYGTGRIPESVCEFWHLNALRSTGNRVHPQPDGTIIWKGGKRALHSKLYDLDIAKAPKSLRDMGRLTLKREPING